MVNYFERATTLAQAAVQNDQQGNYPAAIECYLKAAEFLQKCMRDSTLPTAQRSHAAKAMDSYLSRVETLKQAVPSTSQELLPSPPSSSPNQTSLVTSTRSAPPSFSPQMYPSQQNYGQQDPSLLQVGLAVASVVNQHGGKVVLGGIQKALEINSEYKVTDRVYSAASTTYAAAVKANREYQITDKVADTAKTLYQSSKDVNEKHQVTQKLATTAKATATALTNLNNEYKVTERVGNALIAGLNFVSSKAQDYLAQNESSSSSSSVNPSQAALPAPVAPTYATATMTSSSSSTLKK